MLCQPLPRVDTCLPTEPKGTVQGPVRGAGCCLEKALRSDGQGKCRLFPGLIDVRRKACDWVMTRPSALAGGVDGGRPSRTNNAHAWRVDLRNRVRVRCWVGAEGDLVWWHGEVGSTASKLSTSPNRDDCVGSSEPMASSGRGFPMLVACLTRRHLGRRSPRVVCGGSWISVRSMRKSDVTGACILYPLEPCHHSTRAVVHPPASGSMRAPFIPDGPRIFPESSSEEPASTQPATPYQLPPCFSG